MIRVFNYGLALTYSFAHATRAAVLYQLALRAGNEKDEDAADTVGCCSLRVEHVKLMRSGGETDDVKYLLDLDFLGGYSVGVLALCCWQPVQLHS